MTKKAAVIFSFVAGLVIGVTGTVALTVPYVHQITQYNATIESQLFTEESANGGVALERCDLTFGSGAKLYRVQQASTEQQQGRGLSHRGSAGQGMYFPLPKPDKMVFWMRDTYFPLTVGFFDPDGVLFRLEDMEPNTDTFHFSEAVASGALELPRGDFEGHRIRVGDKLTLVHCP